ncbi:MAG: GNAT family N-acetyltransferase [Candidatus Vogelbacteria bacterium]|nr:GNAT family N-acetyltransferase [Candidatus Vogelbacteria bacterium]
MKITDLTIDKHELWNEFCLASNDAWFWHTTGWLDYCEAYGKEKFQTRNLSFMLADDTGTVAVCPLLIERTKKENEIERAEFSTAGSGGFGISPALRNDLSEDRKDKILKEIFEKVDELAKDNQVARAVFRSNPLAVNKAEFNFLIKYGYLDHSSNTQIIDLTLPLEKLWGNLRKGHKYDVNRGKKHYQTHIYDNNNADKNVFDQYRLLHHKAAGRVTRPVETFEMMYQWIKNGEGMLCGVSREGKFAGFSYICLYKDAAYYGSASDDPEFVTDVPLSHVVQWAVIEWLKDNGYKKYEIGLQQFGPQPHDIPSPKDLSISFFKRGFGGKTIPLFRGVKYYDQEFMKKELDEKLRMLVANYGV